MSLSIDLNADLGEGAGHDEELLALVTSANVACGVHAGDVATMHATLAIARERGVAVGAHPGFDDREHFGRRDLHLAPAELRALLHYQLGAFDAVARSIGVRARHVKPHGALYNLAARDEAVAEIVVQSVRAMNREWFVFAPCESALSRAARAADLRVACEVFADRNYTPDGALVPRGSPGALLHDPEIAADRVFRMLRDGRVEAIDGTDVHVEVDTVCLHGDTPDAVQFAIALRRCLAQTGVIISPPGDPI